MDEREVSDADYEPLWNLHVATMRAYIGATWGWDEPEQRLRFDRAWPSWRTGRVLSEGGAIAAAWRTQPAGDHLELLSLEVAPAWQSRGIGSQLVLRLLTLAANAGQPLQVRVLRVNPRAARFFVRLGFTQISGDSTHLLLSAGHRLAGQSSIGAR